MPPFLSPVVFDRRSPFFQSDNGSPGGGGSGGNDDDDLTIVGKVDAGTLAIQLDRARRAKKDADNEAKNLRERLRATEGKLAGFEGEGVVVLKGDDAAAYQAYTALGKPDEVKGRLDQFEGVQGELATLKRDTELRDVATTYGYDFDALREFAGTLPVTPYEADVDGAKKTRYRIGEGQSQADVADWVKDQKPHVQRGLAVASNGSTGQQGSGVRVPVQGSGGAPATPATVARDYMGNTYKAPARQA